MAETAIVPVDDFEPHPFLIDEGFASVDNPLKEQFLRFIERSGGDIDDPPVVNQDNQILRGVRQWRAASMLGWDSIEVVKREYDGREEEQLAILNLHDRPDETIEQKVRRAMKYEEVVNDLLEDRMKAGKPLDEMENDPATDHPILELNEGERGRAIAEAAQYLDLDYKETTYWKLKTIVEASDGDGEVADIAEGLLNQLEGDEIKPSKAMNRLDAFKEQLDNGEEGEEEEADDSEPVMHPTGTSRPSGAIKGEYRFTPVLGKGGGPALIASHGDNFPTTLGEPSFIGKRRKLYEPVPIGESQDEYVTIGDKQMTWWEENSIIPCYPYVFINPVNEQTVDPDEYSFRRSFRFDDDTFVICDSGGYQIMTGSGDMAPTREDHEFSSGSVHPLELVEWQVRNADAGIVLDFPPYGEEVGRDQYHKWRSVVYEPYMDQSVQNAKVMSERLAQMRRDGDDKAQEFNLLGVIQGDRCTEEASPWHLVEEYHSAMEQALPAVDGWALSAKPSGDLLDHATHLTYAATELQEYEHIHVLQVSGSKHRAVLDYFARLTGFFVTSDASSHLRGVRYGKMEVPSAVGTDLDVGTKSDFDFGQYPCSCPVCRAAREKVGDDYLTADSELSGHLLNLHNLYQALQFHSTSSALLEACMEDDSTDLLGDLSVADESIDIKNSNRFWQWLSRRYSDNTVAKIWQAMAAIREAVDNGRDSVVAKGLLGTETDAMEW